MDKIIKLIQELKKVMLLNKEMLTIDELSLYTGYSVDYIYKMVHQNTIPYSKPPQGRKLFFNRVEIISWLNYESNTPDYILDNQARDFVTKNSNNK
jgi:excisionase family DNA binding protein